MAAPVANTFFKPKLELGKKLKTVAVGGEELLSVVDVIID